jgi:hypothetical protein
MGKGSGGGAWWAILLLAGVLFAAAATAASAADEEVASAAGEVVVAAAEADRDRKEDLQWCRRGCQWQYGQDHRRLRECERECRQHHRGQDGKVQEEEEEVAADVDVLGSGTAQCRWRCVHRYHDEPRRVQECMKRCSRRSEQQDDDDGVEEEEEGESIGAGALNWQKCRERCERRHAGDWQKRQRCLMECRRREQEEEEEGGAEADADNSRGDRCQRRCHRYSD